jgi:4-amino-4-deoxy-L-arabinose transferase-like glycosyltransferase
MQIERKEVLSWTASASILSIILVLGLLLRLYCLDCHSLWYDEIASIETARRGIDAIFTYRFGWLGNQTHLHYLLVWLTTLPLDPAASPLLVRLPSALAGSLTPLLVYGLGKSLFGSIPAFVAALLSALSPVLLDYSQDVRPYSVLTFLTVLVVYCLLRAEQSGQARWWAAFTVAALVNLLYSYFAVILVLPALAPYLLALLIRYRRIGEKKNTFYLPIASTLTIVIVAGLMLFSLRAASDSTIDLSRFSVSHSVALVVGLVKWIMQAGLDARVVAAAQILCFMAVVLGTYASIRHGGMALRGVLLCWAMVIIPGLLLALLQTNHLVFERYAVFATPFYLLLVGNGLAAAWNYETLKRIRRAVTLPAAALSIIVLLFFIAGAISYATSPGTEKISMKPDFRGAAAYLSDVVTKRDLALFVDEPAHGATVAGFYGFGLPNMPAYNVRDPRVLGQTAIGDIYWVLSFVPDKFHLAENLAAPDQGWADVRHFDGVLVLKDADTGASIAQRMNRLVTKMEATTRNNPSVKILRACVEQAQGDIATALMGYQEVGAYTPLGGEHFRTAEGFEAIGELERAWQEAMLAKHAEPDRLDLHQWMAHMLKDEGYTEQSRVEEQIVDGLKRLR